MPNHVHVVMDIWHTPLSRVIKRWKGATATSANRILKRSGPFWQMDYWDTLIRDKPHLQRAIRYVESNPTKAKLATDAKHWDWSSARWKDDYGKFKENTA